MRDPGVLSDWGCMESMDIISISITSNFPFFLVTLFTRYLYRMTGMKPIKTSQSRRDALEEGAETHHHGSESGG